MKTPEVPVDQQQPQYYCIEPYQEVELLVNDDLLVLSDPEQVAGHDAQDVALAPPAPGAEIIGRQMVVALPLHVLDVVTTVPEQSPGILQSIRKKMYQ